ncbi:hypothetical protein [Streptosporangium roseum]|uniref:hypothetical protein n=1 Tax=Streptosporangium roseum TaxID=2001 RepID=UPI0004CC9A6A|nr:hypothetical protein [Streptosporangium roseum]
MSTNKPPDTPKSGPPERPQQPDWARRLAEQADLADATLATQGKGDLEVKSSDAVVEGAPAAIPNHKDNAWTSDHAAVLTTFAVR